MRQRDILFGLVASCAFSPALGQSTLQEPHDARPGTASEAVAGGFDTALARYVAGNSADARAALIETARADLQKWRPHDAFPAEQGELFELRQAARDRAEAATKAGNLTEAEQAGRVSAALWLARTSNPMAPGDVYHVVPIIEAVACQGRIADAARLYGILLASPDPDVAEAATLAVAGRLNHLMDAKRLDDADRLAEVGERAISGGDKSRAYDATRFIETRRIVANRRALAQLPATVSEPLPDRMGATELAAADALLEQAITDIAEGRREQVSVSLRRAGETYGRAWEPAIGFPALPIAQAELAYKLDGPIKSAEENGRLAAAAVARRLALALRMAKDPVIDGHELASLAMAMIRSGDVATAERLVSAVASSSSDDARLQMAAQLAGEAEAMLQANRLDDADRLAMIGGRLFATPRDQEQERTQRFARVHQGVLGQRPAPVYPEQLPTPVPARISASVRTEADRRFGEAVELVLAGHFDRSRPLFLDSAATYAIGFAELEIPEYRLHQLSLASPARNAAHAAMTTGAFAEAELAFRLAAALTLADDTGSGDPFALSEASAITAIGIALYRQERMDDARALLRRIVKAIDAQAAAAPGIEVSREAYRLKQMGKLDEAEAAARFGVSLYDNGLDDGGGAPSELAAMLGEILSQKGQTAEAAPLLQGAVGGEDGSSSFETSRNATALIVNMIQSGRLAEARPLISKEIGGASDIDAARWLINTSQSSLGGYNDDARLALARLALTLYAKRLKPTDMSLIGAQLVTADLLSTKGLWTEAEPLYRQALISAEARYSLDSHIAHQALAGLAQALLSLGRPEDAEALHRRYWAISQRYADPANEGYEEAFANLFDILLYQDKLAEAETFSDAALGAARAAPKIAPEILARYELEHARILQRTERIEEAAALVTSANERAPSWRSRSSLAILLELGDKPAAAEPLRRALVEDIRADFRVGPYSVASLQMRLALAHNLALQGRTAEADALHAELVKLSRDVFGGSSTPFAEAAEQRALHLIGPRSGEAVAVARDALAARTAMRRIRGLQTSDAALLATSQQERFAAGLFIRAAVASGTDAQAELFDALQRAGTSPAAIALARSAAGDAARASGAERHVASWHGAQAALLAIDTRIAEAAARGPAGDAERKLASAERPSAAAALATAEADLQRRFPRFFDLVSASPVTLERFSGADGLLRADEALIIINPGLASLPEDQRFGTIFVATRDGVALAPLSLSADALSDAVKRFHETLDRSGETDSRSFDPPTRRFSRDEAYALYRSLFGAPSVAALLLPKTRWTIAPQGVLASLPFAALVTSPPPGGTRADTDPVALRATAWLGVERALAIVPSVSAIEMQRRFPASTDAGPRRPFFGVGDPAFQGIGDPELPAPVEARSATPSKGRGTREPAAPLPDVSTYARSGWADLDAVAKLKRLTATGGEIRTLASMLGADSDDFVLQLDATEAEIRRRSQAGSLGRTDVIAFATHGLMAGQLTHTLVEPALAVTPPALSGSARANPDPANDGLLTASEIAALPISARFVILSACNTAARGTADTESLSGLARAFFFAGARSLLVSHFEVFDSAAPLLTGEAVRLTTVDKLDAPEALRRAMVALIRNSSNDEAGLSFAHPKSWAPFVAIDAN